MGMVGLHAPIPNLAPGNLGLIAQFRAKVSGFTTPKAKQTRPFWAAIVHPDQLSMEEWADAFVYANSPTLTLPQYQGDFDAWAMQVVQEPQLQRFQLPAHAPNWQQWAETVNAALATVGAL